MVLTYTREDGKYDLRLPAPETKTIHLVFRKEGNQGDEVTVPAGKPFQTDLIPVKSK